MVEQAMQWVGCLPPTPKNISRGRGGEAAANCGDSEKCFLSLIFQLGFSGSASLNY